ncbi:signal peptide peptidase SppA, 67K type [[Leptolyngbya] sp. PCC 7376]|uniref:signal peptide peptidase SppA n=1 Tax=[Leptolyngbya] sp. PCC 7376 TaxID=111781 RepID=UPI00029F431A|nr:signal peptide peptidase SppA [[Leptolyngbya] sp. PCC 7376]AFY36742.1 signal peptide peptidase SppA, 67K type [[Leptolyngbya] sp. PCC 7376]
MKDFFKQIFSSCLGTMLALGLLSTLSITAFVALIALFSSQDSTSYVEDESILVFDSSLIIQDRQPSSSVGDVLVGDIPNVMSLRDVTKTIRAAAEDAKITGLFIDGRMDGFNGYATLKEVRQALKAFKEAGKKIYAYDVNLTEREFYLTSLADEIWLNPIGAMEINGFGAEQMFWTGALEKYGIGVQVVRVGSYKGAVEPFTLKEFSPENREQTQAFLGDLWSEFKNTTAGDRPFDANALQTIANNQGIIEPEAAKSAELVTRLAYFDEILAELKTFTGTDEDEDLPQISLTAYRDKLALEDFGEFSDNIVAVVYAEGGIVGGEGTPTSIGGDSLSRELRQLRFDDQVKALVLRINSPGGSAIASDIILRELKLIREAGIPVIVSMGDIAASGGYWIATESDYIFAHNNTITGSIGVFGLLPNIQKIGNDNGFTWDTVQTGDLATLGSGSRPKTEKELAIFQGFVNDIYDDFLERVAQSRGLTKDEVNKIAQGRVWSGEDAKNIKLVDEIGGLDAAIAHAVKVAELGDDYSVGEYPLQQTWEEELLENLFGNQDAFLGDDVVTQEWQKFQEGLELWRSLNDPKQVYAIFPWQMDID